MPAFETFLFPLSFTSALIAQPDDSNFCKAKDKERGAAN
jgi:hypothetical protein